MATVGGGCVGFTCNSRVSLESRYGTCVAFLSVRALITIPSVVKDLLICFASSSCWPSALLLCALSEPARSTKHSFPDFCSPRPLCFCVTAIVKMEWLRDDSLFIRVEATIRLAAPVCIR